MTQQNIYDDPDFFAGYSRLPRAQEGLDAVYEWTGFQRLLPVSLEAAKVLDLGCGLGYFARWVRGRGARQVTAVDLSDNMLRRARGFGDDPGILYVRSSLEDYLPEPAAFDLIVSMLSVHYVADYPAIVRRIAAALKPGGRFALSVEHPIFSANPTGDWTAAGWPIDGYRNEGARRRHWFVDGVVRYHRTVETYVNTLLGAGLTLMRLEEPEAEADFLASRPDAAVERRRPPFLLLAADRPAEKIAGGLIDGDA